MPDDDTLHSDIDQSKRALADLLARESETEPRELLGLDLGPVLDDPLDRCNRGFVSIGYGDAFKRRFDVGCY
jgi:hypothetical protein